MSVLATSLMHGDQIRLTGSYVVDEVPTELDGELLTVGPAGWNYTASTVDMQMIDEAKKVRIVQLSQVDEYDVVSKVTEAEAQPKGRD